jgi:monovalent cation:H+ antiporter, CPA1 family
MPIAALGVILLTASLVAVVTRRMRLPYSVGLVAAGMALALLPRGLDLPLSRDLIFNVFLPPLIFEAALRLEWRYFRRELPATFLLAFPGAAVAAGAVGVGMHVLLGWPLISAAFFGALIAATDPISVLAAFKQLSVQPRLSLLVETESLLNDGAAAVAFAVLAGIVAGTSGTPLLVAASLIWATLGGVAIGCLVAAALLFIAGQSEDHLVEITLTTIAAYGSFLAAEYVAASGVLASLSAGLLVGNIGWRRAISATGRGHILAFWNYAAFLANSIVFILIGSHEAHQLMRMFSTASAAAIALVLVGRALAVYSLSTLLTRTTLRLSLPYQHVLVWGGLRGALALALALALPQDLPNRQEIIVVAFTVVTFSIFIQGLTVPSLIRYLKLTGRPDEPHLVRDAD